MTLAEAFFKLAKLLKDFENKNINLTALMENKPYQSEIVQIGTLSAHTQISELAFAISSTLQTLGSSAMLKSKLITHSAKDKQQNETAPVIQAPEPVLPKKAPQIKQSNLGKSIFILLIVSVSTTAFFYFQHKTEQSGNTIIDTPLPEIPNVSLNTNTNQQTETVSTIVDKHELLFRIHGSNTVGEQLAPKLLKAFLEQKQANSLSLEKSSVPVEKKLNAVMNKNPVSVEIHAHGSSTGFKSLLLGKADMSMSSRKIKNEEVQQLKGIYGSLDASGNEHIIGIDGLAVIVHPANPINSLSSRQVAQLFSGQIDNWQQLGGKPGKVKIFARDENSGTWDSFKTMILKKNKVKLMPSATRYESSSELSQQVSQNINAIGFIGLPYVLEAKALAISDSEKIQPVYPTSFTVATEDYPLSRRLYMYSPETPSTPLIREFIRFVLSDPGQKIVQATGFVSQNIKAIKPTINQNAPKEFIKLTKYAERLSLTLRFNPGRAELDNKGKRDMKRILRYIQNHPEKSLMLLGFTDSLGDYQSNLRLSTQRAQMISDLFEAHGISAKAIAGFGEANPVANNQTAFGRFKNRRVEIWVI